MVLNIKKVLFAGKFLPYIYLFASAFGLLILASIYINGSSQPTEITGNRDADGQRLSLDQENKNLISETVTTFNFTTNGELTDAKATLVSLDEQVELILDLGSNSEVDGYSLALHHGSCQDLNEQRISLGELDNSGKSIEITTEVKDFIQESRPLVIKNLDGEVLFCTNIKL